MSHRPALRQHLHAMPLVGPLLRWFKSLACLNRTREQAAVTDELIGPLREEVARLSERAQWLHGEILSQERRLNRASPPTAAPATAPPADSHVGERLASFYEAFEDRFRGERDDIKQRHGVYLPAIRDAGAGTAERPILDIGCGRGEWLELLGENGLSARGIDVNSAAVAACQERGLDAAEADLIAALEAVPPGSLGAVTAFHVIEHLPLDVLIAFLDGAREALAPSGLLILETPNPENLIVGAHTFHNDPTHKAPIPPAVGQFMAEQRGFGAVRIERLHPRTERERLPGNDATTARLNDLLYGPQDYAVLARRP